MSDDERSCPHCQAPRTRPRPTAHGKGHARVAAGRRTRPVSPRRPPLRRCRGVEAAEARRISPSWASHWSSSWARGVPSRGPSARRTGSARRSGSATRAQASAAADAPRAAVIAPNVPRPQDASERCELRIFRGPTGGEPVVVVTEPGKLTEFRPDYYGSRSRLTREVVRQAVLMAARDRLNLPVRDPVIGDPTPAGAPVGGARSRCSVPE